MRQKTATVGDETGKKVTADLTQRCGDAGHLKEREEPGLLRVR
jgi:hypothetical protein